jgi:hypothetical protein
MISAGFNPLSLADADFSVNGNLDIVSAVASDLRERQKIEGLGFSFPSPLTAFGCARLRRVSAA